MAIFLRNTTATEVTIADMGLYITPLGLHDVHDEGYDRVRRSKDLRAFITNGTIAIIKSFDPEVHWTAEQSLVFIDTFISPEPDFIGSGAMTIPRGTLAQRPSEPQPGMIRLNTDSDQLELFLEEDWTQIVYADDPRLFTYHTLRVDKNAGADEFDSVATALASITDNSATSRYRIEVGSGIFVEPQMQMKPYVTVRGAGSRSTVIEAADPADHLFITANFAGLHDCLLTGVTATGKAAIYHNTPDGETTTAFYMTGIRFGSNDTQVFVEANTSGKTSAVYLTDCFIGSNYTFRRGFYATGTNGGRARIILRTVFTTGVTLPNPEEIIHITGETTEALIVSSAFRTGTTGLGVGLRVSNGAKARLAAASFSGFDKGIWLENAGTRPILRASGILSEDNTCDLCIDHPGAIGSFFGQAERNKINIVDGSDVSVLYLDPVEKGAAILGPLYLGDSHNTSADVRDLIEDAATMGVLHGGELSTSSTGMLDISVAAGYGYVSDSDNDHAIKRLEWDDSVITVDPDIVAYVIINRNGEIGTSQSLPRTDENIVLGRVITHEYGFIVQRIPVNAHHAVNSIDTFIREALGPIYVTGSIVTEGTTPLSLNVTGGTYYYAQSRFTPVGGTSVALYEVYNDSNGPYYNIIPQTTVSNSYYDDGTGLVALQSGRYTKHALYVTGDGEQEAYILLYGQEEFATLIEAEEGFMPAPPMGLDVNITAIAAIIVQEGNTNIVSIQDVRPVIGFKASGVSASAQHGNLLGLDSDDHPQYLLRNGTRSLSGSLNLGGFDITNVDLVDGVDVTTHAARHTPNGADPLPTASSVGLSLSSVDGEGIQNSFARSDHTHSLSGVQPISANLTALAGITETGIYAKTDSSTVAARSIVGAPAGVGVNNGDGVSGNPTITLTNDLAALEGLSSTGIAIRSANDTWLTRSIAGTTNQIGVSNGSGVSGSPTIALASNAILPGTGAVTVPKGTTAQRPTAAAGMLRYDTSTNLLDLYDGSWNTVATRAHVAATYQPLDDDLTALAGLATSGLVIRSAAGQIVTRALATSGNGLTVTDGDGVAANPTIALSGDVAALEALTGTGLAARTGNETWSLWNISGTAGQVGVNSTAGVISIGLSADPVLPGTGAVTLPGGSTAQRPTATNGMIRHNSENGIIEVYIGNSWKNVGGVTQIDAGLGLTGGPITSSGTISVAGNLASLVGISTAGFLTRSAANTLSPRTITGTANQISVSNGNGASGNPVIALVANPSIPGTSSLSVPVGTTAQRPISPAGGMVRFNTDIEAFEVYQRGSWVPLSVQEKYIFTADVFLNPVNSNWAVNALAPASTHPTHPALIVRAFDDTAEEGIGFTLSPPAGGTTMTLNIKGAPATAPAGSRAVIMRLYYRAIPPNAAIGSWQGTTLTALTIPTNSFFQYVSQTFDFSTLGLTGGILYQFELTRMGQSVSDTLVGDYLLAQMEVEYA